MPPVPLHRPKLPHLFPITDRDRSSKSKSALFIAAISQTIATSWLRIKPLHHLVLGLHASSLSPCVYFLGFGRPATTFPDSAFINSSQYEAARINFLTSHSEAGKRHRVVCAPLSSAVDLRDARHFGASAAMSSRVSTTPLLSPGHSAVAIPGADPAPLRRTAPCRVPTPLWQRRVSLLLQDVAWPARLRSTTSGGKEFPSG